MHICVNARLIFKKCNCEIIVSDSFFSEFNINQLNFAKILNYNFEGSDFRLMDGEIIKKHENFFIYPDFCKMCKEKDNFYSDFSLAPRLSDLPQTPDAIPGKTRFQKKNIGH